MVKTPSFDRLGTSVSSRVLGGASLDRVFRKTLIIRRKCLFDGR